MNIKNVKSVSYYLFNLACITCLSLVVSCSADAPIEELMDVVPEIAEEMKEEVVEEVMQPCTNTSNFIFNEKDGLVTIEFEDATFSGDWKLKSDGDSFTGKGYMVWEGTQHLSDPGTGMATYKIKIENTGTYQFIWKSAVKTGNNGTDHNDSWVRFNDATNFYAQKGDSRVYPKDVGKIPNPAGASKDGWFKIYRSGSNLDFKWQSSTFDNNGHDVFVSFESPGIYTMEISARSSGHGIDKFVLFNTAVTKAAAIVDTNALSAITCN